MGICVSPFLLSCLICIGRSCYTMAMRDCSLPKKETTKHWETYTKLGSLNMAVPHGAASDDASFASENTPRPFFPPSFGMVLPWGPVAKDRPLYNGRPPESRGSSLGG